MNPMNPPSSGAAWLIAVALHLCLLVPAHGQSYPNRPVRMVVASAPGGNIDFVARVVADKLTGALGQPIVVDNKAGAAGNIATEIVAKAAPDGHTLLVVATSHSTNLHLRAKMSFDPVKDFVPVTQLGSSYFVLAVHPASEFKSIADIVAAAKSRRGKLNYSSAGIGQANHLGMELLKSLAGFDAVHVPYTSMGAAQTAVMSQQVDLAILSLPGAVPAAAAGKLRILGMTGPKRSAQNPDIPSIAELGYPTFQITGWQGLLVPAGTPPAIIERLHRETVKALRDPGVIEQLKRGALDPVGSTPKEFADFIDAEMSRWGRVIRQAGIKAE